MENVQKKYALVLGIFLILLGLLGLLIKGMTGELLGLFGINLTQTILFIIAGAFGIYVSIKREGPGYNLSIGWIGILFGILGFIPGIKTFLTTFLNSNIEMTILHLVIGLASLGVYYGSDKTTV